MRSSSFYILVFLVLVFYSCKQDVPIPIKQDPCGAKDLDITRAAIQVAPNEDARPFYDTAWYWTRTYDTLTVKYHQSGYCPGGSIRYLQFVVSDCISLVRDYKYTYAFNNTFVDPFTITIQDDELNFELQEWDEQKALVGKNNDIEFWIEFNEDNRY